MSRHLGTYSDSLASGITHITSSIISHIQRYMAVTLFVYFVLASSWSLKSHRNVGGGRGVEGCGITLHKSATIMTKGISVGLSKGHAVTARTLAPRPGSRKGVSQRVYSSLSY